MSASNCKKIIFSNIQQCWTEQKQGNGVSQIIYSVYQ